MFNLFYHDFQGMELKQLREVLEKQPEVEALQKEVYQRLRLILNSSPSERKSWERNVKTALKRLYDVLNFEEHEIRSILKEEEKREDQPEVYTHDVGHGTFVLNKDCIFKGDLANARFCSEKAITLEFVGDVAIVRIQAPRATVIFHGTTGKGVVLAKEIILKEGAGMGHASLTAHKVKNEGADIGIAKINQI